MKTILITMTLALAAFVAQAGGEACNKNKAACADKNKTACTQKAKAAGATCSSVSKVAVLSPKAAEAKR